MAGVILVLGPERFLARQAVEAIVADHPLLEFSRFHGGDIEVREALDDLRTPTLLGEPRGVVVEDAGPVLEGESLAAVAAYAEKPVAGALLVLQASALDRRLKEVKRLLQHVETVECKPPPPKAVAAWLSQHARQAYGLALAGGVGETLRDRLGDDLGQLDGALARLKEQIAPRVRLERADVAASTDDHRSPVLWEASNALEEADLPRALDAVDAAFLEGIRIKQDTVSDPSAVAPILLASLHGAYRKLIKFHLSRHGGAGAAEAARAAGFPAWKANLASRHHRATLVARHRHFVAADLALKRSYGDSPRRVLERLLVALLSRETTSVS